MIEIYTESVSASSLQINPMEALRYMGGGHADETTKKMLAECEREAKSHAEPRAVYVRVPVYVCEDKVDFGFMTVKSKNLAKNLDGCQEAYVFAATLGMETDRCFKRIAATSSATAMVYGAVCSALIESFCDYLNEKLASGLDTRPRFSCGYGDFCLEHQADILNVLNASKSLGVYLTDSYMMVPVKTVTAIIGIRR